MATATMSGAERRQRRIAFLVRRDGPDCHYCGCHLEYDEITLDHVTPRSKGGSDGLWNLVLSCAACNQEKADKLIAQPKYQRPQDSACRVCKNGRRIPDEEDHCWACLRPNLRSKAPVRACHHVATWCIACA